MNQYAVVGLGYVGLGLATAFSKENNLIGYDINETRIHELSRHFDRNGLIPSNDLSNTNLTFTSHIEDIKHANFYIVAVATPAYFYEIPNLEPLIGATKQLASILNKNDIIVFESTVYPGTTEEICIPLLESISGLQHGKDFHVGYSPERINPGDEHHTLKNITKIVSAPDEETLKIIQVAYETICDKVYPVSSIATAEAIKLLENTQRDVNIALMNEFTKITHALDLNTHEIIEAAKTKWSFMPYKPGFVGGHCISIDPHYLAFKAKRIGVQPELMLAARRVNDGMTQFIIQSMMKILIQNNIDKNNLSIGVFGVSYKENVPDLRNSLSLKLVKELREYGFICHVHDPLTDEDSHHRPLEKFEEIDALSVAIITVAHDFYRDIGLEKLISKCKQPAVVMDIPNLFIDESKRHNHLIYWSL